jgi:hypothetical protein
MTTRPHPRNIRLSAVLRALPFVALPLLAACVEPTSPGATQAPVVAPGIDPAAGLPREAVVSVMAMNDLGERLVVVLFSTARVTSAQLDAAPAIVCANQKRKLLSSEVKPLDHAGELPGAKKLVIRCK